MRARTIFCAALLVALALQAGAACIQSEPNRVATVTIASCSTVAELARIRLGNVDLPWVVRHVQSVVERHKGVVIAGKVTRKIHVEQYGNEDFRLLDVVMADETGTWFLRGDNLSCDAFEPQAAVEIYATQKCCDVFPPGDVPCVLGVEQAHLPGEALLRLLQSAGLR